MADTIDAVIMQIDDQSTMEKIRGLRDEISRENSALLEERASLNSRFIVLHEKLQRLQELCPHPHLQSTMIKGISVQTCEDCGLVE